MHLVACCTCSTRHDFIGKKDGFRLRRARYFAVCACLSRLLARVTQFLHRGSLYRRARGVSIIFPPFFRRFVVPLAIEACTMGATTAFATSIIFPISRYCYDSVKIHPPIEFPDKAQLGRDGALKRTWHTCATLLSMPPSVRFHFRPPPPLKYASLCVRDVSCMNSSEVSRV